VSLCIYDLWTTSCTHYKLYIVNAEISNFFFVFEYVSWECHSFNQKAKL